jgi:hypothetical protein
LVYYESRIRRKETAPERASGEDKAPPAGEHAGGDEEEVFARTMKLWPLVSYRREEDTASTKALSLWPVHDMSSIDRNWAPFWQLYTRARVRDAVEDEFLWGMFRYRRDQKGMRRFSLFPVFSTRRIEEGEGGREWSFLLGLLGYRREGLRKSYRLLYFIRFGDTE